MKIIQQLISRYRLLLGLALCAASFGSYAEVCDKVSSGIYQYKFCVGNSAANPTSVPFGNVKLAGTAIGSVLKSYTISSTFTSTQSSASGNLLDIAIDFSYFSSAQTMSSQCSGGGDMTKLAYIGRCDVGLRATLNGAVLDPAATNIPDYPAQRPSGIESIPWWETATYSSPMDIVFDLVKVAESTNETGYTSIPVTPLFTLTTWADAGGKMKELIPARLMFNIPTISFIDPPCRLTNSATTVVLGNVSLDEIASGVSREVPLTLGMNCPRADLRPDITLNGTTFHDTSVLALTEGSDNAGGVGIQFLHNGAPVVIGTPFSVGTLDSAGNVSVPLSVRYKQVASGSEAKLAVTPGRANGMATINITYE